MIVSFPSSDYDDTGRDTCHSLPIYIDLPRSAAVEMKCVEIKVAASAAAYNMLTVRGPPFNLQGEGRDWRIFEINILRPSFQMNNCLKDM